MALQAYRAVFHDGQIKLQGSVELQEGDELIVTVLRSTEEGIDEGISAADLLNAPFIGVWADRADIGDSVEFAEKLRRQWENRLDGSD